MARFPDTIDRTIQDFAGSLGIPARPSSDGTYSFRFGNGDVLTFTPADRPEAVLMSIAFKPDRPGDQIESAALASAGFNASQDRFTHVGLASDGTIVIAQGLEANRINLPEIDASLLYLRAVRSSIG